MRELATVAVERGLAVAAAAVRAPVRRMRRLVATRMPAVARKPVQVVAHASEKGPQEETAAAPPERASPERWQLQRLQAAAASARPEALLASCRMRTSVVPSG